jgi:hypothetical protein
MDIGSRAVDEAARQAGFQFLGLLLLVAHDRDSIAGGPLGRPYLCAVSLQRRAPDKARKGRCTF